MKVVIFIFSALYTVMCYNVLCDKYATRQLYGYCPSWALNWEYRKKGIIEEIRHYSADIISLQVRIPVPYSFFFLDTNCWPFSYLIIMNVML